MSVPEKPASGKYVATPLFSPTVPCKGCERIWKERPDPAPGSVTESGRPILAWAERSAALGAGLVFMLSLEGPLWQV